MAEVTSANKDVAALTPSAQKACRLFLEGCRAEGLDIFITETYRSQERQDYLYSLGRTRAGSIVTWTKNSRHTLRRAWDIACTPPAALYDADILRRCGAIAAKLGITWGGTWSTPDTPHFEISENWNYEEESMTAAEIAKMQAIDDSLTNLYGIVQDMADRQRVYNSVDELPEWAKADIRELVDSGIVRGGENGALNLDMNMLRMLIIVKRMIE